MKTILFILIILTAKLTSQKTPIWQFNSYNIGSIYILNDNELLVHTSNNEGTTYLLEIESGEIKDSIVHGIKFIRFTDILGDLIAVNSIELGGMFNFKTKEIIFKREFGKFDVAIKDENELFVIKENEGLFKYLVNEDRFEVIWNDFPKNGWELPKYYPRQNSIFDKDNKLAAISLGDGNWEGAILIDVATGEQKAIIGGEDINFNPEYDELYTLYDTKIYFYNTITFEEIKTIDLKKYSNLGAVGYFSFSTDGNFITTIILNELFILKNDDELSIDKKCLVFGLVNIPHLNYLISQNSKYVRVYDINSLDVKDNIHSTIYPNPTSDIINIDTENKVNIELFDIFGNKLLEDFSTKLNISKLTPGTYYIRYSGHTQMVVKI